MDSGWTFLMRICYVADGSTVHVQRWIEWFMNRGHDVHLITAAPAPFERGAVSRAPIDKGFFVPRPRITRYVRKVIRQIAPDIVHAHSVLGFGMYAALSVFHPVVLSAWGSDIAAAPQRSRYIRKICGFVVRRADLLHVGDSESVKTVTGLGADPARCLVQMWGVDTDTFSPSKRDESLRDSLCSSGDLLFFANRSLEPIYKHEILLRAARDLSMQTKGFFIAIAGSGSSLPELHALSERLGIRQNVRFLGVIPPEEMPSYYASSDAYIDCFSSQIPGHGASLSLLEAMASGLPPVLASRPGLQDLVEPAVSGYLFEPDNPSKLSQVLNKLMLNREDLREIGTEAARRAKKLGDREKNLAAFEMRMAELCRQ